MCLPRSDSDNQNDAILSWGDVKGNVHAVLFNSALIALFERPPQQSNENCIEFFIDLNSNVFSLSFDFLAYTKVRLEDIANGTYKNASYITYHAHTEWTRKGFSLK